MTVLQNSVNWVLANAKARLGDPYVYGGVYSGDVEQGADCSGVVGWVLEALTKTPANMSWAHNVSTESWYFDYDTNTPAAPGTVGPYGTIAVASLDNIPPDAALTIDIYHGGGGVDSHTNCSLRGTLIESNGDYGSCTNGTGAYATDDALWTDHWFLPGPIGDPAPTLYYPDVANVQWGLPFSTQGQQQLLGFLAQLKPEGFAGAVHKATQGSGFQDPYFATFRNYCENNDLSWLGYHYVTTDDPGAQAANWVANNGGPFAMLDVESGSGNMNTFWNVVNAFNAAGINVTQAYIPHWYWQQIGEPNLSLAENQIALVSSNYPAGNGYASQIFTDAGGDGGPGWASYGGDSPRAWQFTDTATIAGIDVDCNAYLGAGPNLDAFFTGAIFN